MINSCVVQPNPYAHQLEWTREQISIFIKYPQQSRNCFFLPVCCAFWCNNFYYACLAARMNENCCVGCSGDPAGCVPGGHIAMRTKLRAQNNIHVSTCCAKFWPTRPQAMPKRCHDNRDCLNKTCHYRSCHDNQPILASKA